MIEHGDSRLLEWRLLVILTGKYNGIIWEIMGVVWDIMDHLG